MTTQDHYEIARQIMGVDFISPEEVPRHIDMPSWIEGPPCFDENFPDVQTLEWAKVNNFILVPGPYNPHTKSIVTLSHLFHAVQGLGSRSYAHKEHVGAFMYMVRKEPLEESFSKSWEEQQSLIPENEYIPSLIEIAWCVSMYNEVRGARLLEDIHVRSSSNDPGAILKRTRAFIGNYSKGKFTFSEFPNSCKNPRVGMLTGRILDSVF